LFEQIVPESLHKFRPIFKPSSFNELPDQRKWDHAIDFVPDANIHDWKSKVYPLSVLEQAKLDEFLEENLRTGRIHPSKSPITAPFFFVKKKSGDLRPVQDYRKLNGMTVKNHYPLPLIPKLIDKIKNAKVFSKLDVRWGYNNMRIREGDEWKATFITNRGCFEPLVMFFGLCNSPTTFQSIMNEIFHEEINEGWLHIYMDDFLITTDTIAENEACLHRVFAKCQDNKLFFKPEKCSFLKDSIDYLGLIIKHSEITMDPSKVDAIRFVLGQPRKL
jgi:Reverse transcriptase (RNA-dependent DNA polymerase)